MVVSLDNTRAKEAPFFRVSFFRRAHRSRSLADEAVVTTFTGTTPCAGPSATRHTILIYSSSNQPTGFGRACLMVDYPLRPAAGKTAPGLELEDARARVEWLRINRLQARPRAPRGPRCGLDT